MFVARARVARRRRERVAACVRARFLVRALVGFAKLKQVERWERGGRGGDGVQLQHQRGQAHGQRCGGACQEGGREGGGGSPVGAVVGARVGSAVVGAAVGGVGGAVEVPWASATPRHMATEIILARIGCHRPMVGQCDR